MGQSSANKNSNISSRDINPQNSKGDIGDSNVVSTVDHSVRHEKSNSVTKHRTQEEHNRKK